MRNIALVGFMGTGKTTIARILADKLRMKWVNIDDLIEQREGKKITDIFKIKGEAYFRQIEKEIVRQTSMQSGIIIACGGGVVLNEENVINLKKTGSLICLSARADVILERTKKFANRPLLNVADPKEKIEELLKLRQPYYAKSDWTLDTSDLSTEEVAAKILEWVKDKN